RLSPPDLHSSPTRRSSDLLHPAGGGATTGGRFAGAPLRDRGDGGRWAGRNGGDLLHLLLLVRGVSLPGGRHPEGALLLREDAGVRQPRRPLRRGVGAAR